MARSTCPSCRDRARRRKRVEWSGWSGCRHVQTLLILMLPWRVIVSASTRKSPWKNAVSLRSLGKLVPIQHPCWRAVYRRSRPSPGARERARHVRGHLLVLPCTQRSPRPLSSASAVMVILEGGGVLGGGCEVHTSSGSWRSWAMKGLTSCLPATRRTCIKQAQIRPARLAL